MEAILFSVPSDAQIEEVNMPLIQKANTIKIDSESEYLEVIEFKKSIKKRISVIKEEFKPSKQSAKETHSRICELEQKALSSLEQANNLIDTVLSDYIFRQREIERKRQEEALRLAQEIARKEAEDQALSMAVELEGMGANVEAEEVLNQPIQNNVVPLVHSVQAAVPKVNGFHVRDYYSAEVFDFKSLILAVAQGKVPVSCLEPNQSFLNSQAAALKGEFNYPGVRVVKTVKPITRR